MPTKQLRDLYGKLGKAHKKLFSSFIGTNHYILYYHTAIFLMFLLVTFQLICKSPAN